MKTNAERIFERAAAAVPIAGARRLKAIAVAEEKLDGLFWANFKGYLMDPPKKSRQMSAVPTDWRDAVRKIAWRIDRDDYPSGSLAVLRRLCPEVPDGAAFWWLVAEYAPSAFDNGRAAKALAAVVQAMAIAHPFHRPFSGHGCLGEALAETGVSEARLVRLLRLPQSDLPEELRRLARLMGKKGDAGRVDWSDAFALLFWGEGQTG